MDINDVRSFITLLGLALFLTLVGWTWWPSRRSAHEEAAMLPFEGETPERARETKRDGE